VNGVPVALFQADGQVYAFADTCIHQERSLSKGTLLHGRVICPGHQWAFDLATGYEESQDRCQPTYAVQVEADTIYVDPTPRIGTTAPAEKEVQA
jgi:nitrite reductase (NADH) small subunit